MTAVRACEILIICGIAIQGYGLYAIHGYEMVLLVLGTEITLLGLMGLLRA